MKYAGIIGIIQQWIFTLTTQHNVNYYCSYYCPIKGNIRAMMTQMHLNNKTTVLCKQALGL